MNSNAQKTILLAAETGGLGGFVFHHPEGTFRLTPSSRTAIRAICDNRRLLRGRGIDWGCGTGCLAIVAARIADVEQVTGLDISAENIEAAAGNAAENGAGGKTVFFQSDSYSPYSDAGRAQLAEYAGQAGFVLANPPSSEGDDGLGWRRAVLRGACGLLRAGGVVFLNISFQYGRERIENLAREIPGFVHEGVIASTGWVPFDLRRADLQHCLAEYVREERRGGVKYGFRRPEDSDAEADMDAQSALDHWRRAGESPLTRWQTHLFRRVEG